MRKILLIPAVALSLLILPSCALIQNATDAVTQTITNPFGPVDIYRVKNVYAATLELVKDYRQYCWAKPYAALMADPVAAPLCKNRRPIVRAAQAARVKAKSAIVVADNFIRNNPSGNAISYVTAAWSAVNEFKNSVPLVK